MPLLLPLGKGLAKSASAATKWRWAGHVEYSTGGASGRLAGLLVTCDQVVVCRGRVLEKPSSPAEARTQHGASMVADLADSDLLGAGLSCKA